MASGAFEFPGPWLVEDTWVSSSSGRDHLAPCPWVSSGQHCGPAEARGTLRKGGYVLSHGSDPLSPRPRVGSANTGRGWPLGGGGREGTHKSERRQKPGTAAAGPGVPCRSWPPPASPTSTTQFVQMQNPGPRPRVRIHSEDMESTCV